MFSFEITFSDKNWHNLKVINSYSVSCVVIENYWWSNMKERIWKNIELTFIPSNPGGPCEEKQWKKNVIVNYHKGNVMKYTAQVYAANASSSLPFASMHVHPSTHQEPWVNLW